MRRSVQVMCAALLGSFACSPIAPAAPDANTITCDNYCAGIMQVCTGANQQYANETECKAICENFAKLPLGDLEDTAVNTVACRIYHTGIASTIDPEIHCFHSGASGGNQCGSWCENYCHLSLANCTGTDAIHPDLEICMSECATFADTGAPGDRTGNTVQCRITFLIEAAIEPPNTLVHCADGSANSNVCI